MSNLKTNNATPLSHLVRLAGVLCCTIFMSACQESGTITTQEQPRSSPLPATPDQSEQWQAWNESLHADTYDLEKGPNTYCAKCHSPTNWDFASTIDDPPNCVSCKFPFEAEPRMAQGNVLIPKEEWANIGCNVCHRVNNGVVESEIAWYNTATSYYETVRISTELCERCHVDTDSLNHKRDLGNSAHSDFTCTDCHDAHSTRASCTGCHPIMTTEKPRFIVEHEPVNDNLECEECHLGSWQSHPMHVQQAGDDDCMSCHGSIIGLAEIAPIQWGHSIIHSSLTCVACHDASELGVGQLDEYGLWITFRSYQSPLGEVTEPYQSHHVERSVTCERCHYPTNPWDISETVD